MIRFNKKIRSEGVDGNFTDDNPRVLVKPNEFPTPLYPEDGEFWKEFATTIECVGMAHDNARYLRGVSSALQDHGIRDAKSAANIVHKDWPTDIMLIGAKFAKSGYKTFTNLENSVFTDKVVLLNHLMAEAAWQVSASSFCAKWHFMVPRPEEVAGAIARNELDAPDQIKMCLYDLVPQTQLASNQISFTMYPEGCPNHPSYNAMHSAAASAAGTVIKVMLDLSDTDRQMIDLTQRNMAYFRTTAGVHYPQDNSTGLWLGQEVVKRWLPQKLLDLGVTRPEIDSALLNAETDWFI